MPISHVSFPEPIFFLLRGKSSLIFNNHFLASLYLTPYVCIPKHYNLVLSIFKHHSNEVTMCGLVTKSCLTLYDSMDYSPLGSSVHGISQARIQEWVAIFFSRGSSQPRDQIFGSSPEPLASRVFWGTQSHTALVAYTPGGQNW